MLILLYSREKPCLPVLNTAYLDGLSSALRGLSRRAHPREHADGVAVGQHVPQAVRGEDHRRVARLQPTL